MMVNLLDDSNFHRQTADMTRLIEMIIQNPVFGIFCIISMLAHPTIYDKRDDFYFKIKNFPNMCSNIPASPTYMYGAYISQLVRYARASGNYSDFLKRHLHLRNRLLEQGYEKIRLIPSLGKFIFRYQDLVEIYSVYTETIIHDVFSHSENI